MTQEELKRFLQQKWTVSEKNNVFYVQMNGEKGNVRISFPPRAACVRIVLPPDIQPLIEKDYDTKKANGEYLVPKIEEALYPFLENVERYFSPAPENTNDNPELEWQKEKAALLRQTNTERIAFITSRRGQEMLRNCLLAKYHGCQITGISQPELLIASHIKPWKDSDDDPKERLSESNCLLLSAALDKLFDKCFISFHAETGEMLVSEAIDRETLNKLGVFPEKMTLKIADEKQASFLRYHNNLLKKRSE